MSDRLEFWQKEAIRAQESSSTSAGRVYIVFSFGFAGLLAIAGFAIVNDSMKVLAATPIAGLFLIVLVVRSTIESLYESGFQRFAELQMRKALLEEGRLAAPIRRVGPHEPKHLSAFSNSGWVLGLGGFVGGSVALYFYALSQDSDWIVMACAVAYSLALIPLAILGWRAVSQVNRFLADPTNLPT